MKSRTTIVLIIGILVVGLAYQLDRFINGYSVTLAKLSLGTNGELILVEKWEDWEREGNIISIWYRPASSEIWGVELIEFWTEEPWRKGSLEYLPVTNEVVIRGKNKIWTYNLDSRASRYGWPGFLFDPEWQPEL